MRIHRIRSQGTGPLPAVDWTPGDCEIIYDDNQQGKTTLIDLLVDTVFAEGRKTIFHNQDRYDSFPETTVTIEDDGDRYTFTDEGAEVNLSDLLEWNMPELHRLLCVRAGDVSLSGPREPGEVWQALASVLEGLEDDYVNALRRTIRQETNITKGLKWSDNQQSNYVESTLLEDVVPGLERADEVEDQLSDLLHRREERRELRQELEVLREQTIPQQKTDIQRLERQLALLDLRRAEEELEEALSLQNRLKRDFGRVDPDFEQPWEEAREAMKALRRDQKQQEERRRTRSRKAEELEDHREAVREELARHEKEITEDESTVKAREEKLDARRETIVEQQRRAAELTRDLEGTPDLPRGLGAGVLLLGLAVLLGGIWTPFAALTPGVYYGTGGVVILLGLALEVLLGRWRRRQSRMVDESRTLLEAMPGRDPDDEDSLVEILQAFVSSSPEEWLRDVRREVDDLRDALQEKRERRSALENELENLEERLEELRANGDDEEEDLERTLEEHEAACESYRQKTGLPDFETYRERLEQRREIEQQLENQISRLTVRLDLEAEDPDPSEIEVVLDRRRESLEDVSDPDASREELEETIETERRTLEDLQETLREREDRLARLNEDLRERNRLLHDLDVDPAHPEELFEKKRTWNRRLKEAVRDRLAGAFILRLLDSLEENYLRRVRDLLGGGEGDGRSLSELYGTVMGDEYRVEYEPDTMSLTVHVDGDETRLPEAALSSGARTHLYFSCRLVALRRLFGEDPGFMLLDDPFLTYFPPRKRRALKLLEPMLNEGWQILFFTVDPAVRDYLVEQQGATVSSIDDLAVSSTTTNP